MKWKMIKNDKPYKIFKVQMKLFKYLLGCSFSYSKAHVWINFNIKEEFLGILSYI